MTSVETVSLMFTDLVDSTATLLSLPTAEAEAVRSTFFVLQRQAIEANGGTEVKSTGDGVMVAFANVGAALDTAVAIQQGLDRHNRRARVPLLVRVGISVGDAVSEDGDYYGEPVVEAARLCDAAVPGQILTTDLVRMLAGSRSPHRFDPVGLLSLKGLPAPLAGVSVAWETHSAATMPLPSRLALAPGPGFVGRVGPRLALDDAVALAGRGGSGAVFVAGEPGIGKTRLAREVALDAAERGATVLLGRCDEDVGAPYAPFVEALDHLVTHAPAAVLERHVRAEGGEVARIVPRLAARVPDVPAAQASDPETERFFLFRAVTALLGTAAAEDPVVLVLDDLQWADRQSLSLLRFLVAEQVPGLLVLAIYRSTELTADHPLQEVLAQLHRLASPVRIDLGGLDLAEVVALVEAAAGHELDADGVSLARAVGDETAGNPFFVSEILRHLVETGQLRRDGERWTMAGDLARLSLPHGVRAVVLQRSGRLDPSAQRLLAVGAVVGREFDLGVVAEVAGLDQAEALAGIEEAVRVALVNEVAARPGRFSFAHAIVEHSLAGAQSAARRRALHRAVAEALEARRPLDPSITHAELAQHWIEGYDAATTGIAIARARAAGDHALGKLAPDEAVRWYDAALRLLDALPGASARDRAELLVGLGTAERHAGQAGYRATLQEAAELAEAAGDARLVAQAALGGFKGIWSLNAGVDTTRIAMLRSALAGLADDDAGLRSRLLAALAVEHYFDHDADQRESAATEAVALARAAGDDTALAFALQARDTLIRLPDRLVERRAQSDELVGLVARLGDPVQQFWAAHAEAIVTYESGEPDRYYGATDDMGRLAERTGQPFLRMFAGFMRATALDLRGDRAGAEATATEALALGDEAGEGARARTYLAAILFRVRRDAGRLDEVVEVLQRARQSTARISTFGPALSLALAELGRFDELDGFRRDLAEGFAAHHRNGLWLSSVSMSAEVAGYAGARDAAAQLYPVLEPYAEQLIWPGIGAHCSVARPLALVATVLERFDEADRYFATAVRIAERFDAPVWRARAQQEWAGMLLRRGASGDVERAGALLAAAGAAAEQLDLPTIAARVRDLRGRTG